MKHETEASNRPSAGDSGKQLLGSRDAKKRGELVEMAFMYKASGLGFGVAKPYGDSERYDFILSSGKKLWRVQVKSTTNFDGYGYRIGTYWKTTAKHLTYTAEQVDFLAGYVIPENTWYILPVAAFTPRKVATVYPHRSTDHGQCEQYREAWGLMLEKP